MSKTPDVEYLQALQYGDQINVNNALSLLHRQLFQQVRRFIKKSKGTTLDAEDVFQDGLLALYKLVRRGGLKPSTDIEAYLFAICKKFMVTGTKKKTGINRRGRKNRPIQN